LALSLAGIAFAVEIWQMGVVMTVLSFGYSFTNPSTLGSISLLSPANEQGAALGTTQGLAALGRIIGPAYGGVIYSFHMTGPYLSGSILALIALSVVLSHYRQLPQSARHAHGA